MSQPMTDRATAVQNAAVLLSNYCGRAGDGPISPCSHDHTEEAQAFVRTVEQYAFPELLWSLLQDDEHSPDLSLREIVNDKIAELEAHALVVPER